MKSQTKKLFIVFVFMITSIVAKAQVGIGTTSPDPSAKLEISSTNQGFLPPRMTYLQRQAIQTPAIGLIIYCTNCGAGTGEPQFYNGTEWVNMIGATALTPAPTLAPTTAISNISKTTALSGGNIINDNGNTITARGLCWSTSPNPTVSNSKTNEIGTTGVFASNISGLTANTLYYVRSYASNASGATGYGTQILFLTALYEIGEAALGGKIAYILQTNDPGYDVNTPHGLVASLQDMSSAAEWGCYNSEILGADGTALGTGNQNTIDIMSGCLTAGIAATLCGDLVEAGYSDWYLPSKAELNILYLNRIAIGGFINNYYWSSSEYSNGGAWTQFFSGGGTNPIYGKNASHYIRAVRTF